MPKKSLKRNYFYLTYNLANYLNFKFCFSFWLSILTLRKKNELSFNKILLPFKSYNDNAPDGILPKCPIITGCILNKKEDKLPLTRK